MDWSTLVSTPIQNKWTELVKTPIKNAWNDLYNSKPVQGIVGGALNQIKDKGWSIPGMQNNSLISPKGNPDNVLIKNDIANSSLPNGATVNPSTQTGYNYARKIMDSNNTIKPETINQPTITPSPIGVGTTISNFTRQPSGQPFYDLIVKTASGKGINPAIAAAGLFNESGIDPNAPDNVNYDSKGKVVSIDRGIAQINNVAYPEVTDKQARDPNFAIPWKINKIAENLARYPDINDAIAVYNLGPTGLAKRKGAGYTHYISGLDAYGQQYINKFAKNLTPELVKELGIKVSPPEEEARINKLISLEQRKKVKKT